MQLVQQLKEQVTIQRDTGNFDAPRQDIANGVEIAILPVLSGGAPNEQGVLQGDYDYDGLMLVPDRNIQRGDIVVRANGQELYIRNNPEPVVNVQLFELTEQKGKR